LQFNNSANISEYIIQNINRSIGGILDTSASIQTNITSTTRTLTTCLYLNVLQTKHCT